MHLCDVDNKQILKKKKVVNSFESTIVSTRYATLRNNWWLQNPGLASLPGAN